MYLLASVGGVNTGDMIFQLLSFLILLAIPLAIIVLFIVLRKRGDRLKRVEKKLDKIISDTDNNKS
ncbi:hypothetical protein [Aquibacillus sediminis]|uniref:hypothetical protein n=1 Tax=Aquibacillus sediminis TaxID=2574734 RepID=UPI00110866DF|nr:hypothetical protein [Aquibacillus sediminis]